MTTMKLADDGDEISVDHDNMPGKVALCTMYDTTIFTPDEARAFAHILTEHASAADGEDARAVPGKVYAVPAGFDPTAPTLGELNAATAIEGLMDRAEVDELAQIAYIGYCETTDGRSAITGAMLPMWEDQAPMVKEAWRSAANAVRLVLDLPPVLEPSATNRRHPTCIDVTKLTEPPRSSWVCGPGCPVVEE